MLCRCSCCRLARRDSVPGAHLSQMIASKSPLPIPTTVIQHKLMPCCLEFVSMYERIKVEYTKLQYLANEALPQILTYILTKIRLMKA